MLIYRRRDLQLFGFTPRGHRKARKQVIGVELRIRARGRWRHVKAYVYWPRRDLRKGNGHVSFEVSTWLTDSVRKERLTFRSAIALRLSLGGRRA